MIQLLENLPSFRPERKSAAIDPTCECIISAQRATDSCNEERPHESLGHLVQLPKQLLHETKIEKLPGNSDNVVLTPGIGLDYGADAQPGPSDYECFAGLTKGADACLPGRRQAVCALRVAVSRLSVRSLS